MSKSVEPDDIRSMTDQQLVNHATVQERVTPLENELKHRLETYIAVHGAINDGYDLWE